MTTETPEEFLDALAEPRRAEIARLDTLIRAAVPDLAARTATGTRPAPRATRA